MPASHQRFFVYSLNKSFRKILFWHKEREAFTVCQQNDLATTTPYWWFLSGRRCSLYEIGPR